MKFMNTQKEIKRQSRKEFEEHFYATWPNHIQQMTNQQLTDLNNDRLKEVNSSYPETMLCLKHWVLTEMANRGI